MNTYISHSAEGTHWTKRDHKYIRKEGNRYIYPEDLKADHSIKQRIALNSQNSRDYKALSNAHRQAVNRQNALNSQGSAAYRQRQISNNRADQWKEVHELQKMEREENHQKALNSHGSSDYRQRSAENAQRMHQDKVRANNGNSARNQEYAMRATQEQNQKREAARARLNNRLAFQENSDRSKSSQNGPAAMSYKYYSDQRIKEKENEENKAKAKAYDEAVTAEKRKKAMYSQKSHEYKPAVDNSKPFVRKANVQEDGHMNVTGGGRHHGKLDKKDQNDPNYNNLSGAAKSERYRRRQAEKAGEKAANKHLIGDILSQFGFAMRSAGASSSNFKKYSDKYNKRYEKAYNKTMKAYKKIDKKNLKEVTRVANRIKAEQEKAALEKASKEQQFRREWRGREMGKKRGTYATKKQ